ncbi:hypothetical protein POM88_023814 [Heracleum sosnowskyi]|uniref:Replication protein A OB domain-containing protein n=1 Tax=Heracleum sosnowskyi TaxID=360622 RepID=A0AAD8IHQ0_9APIA|nr:hypothetical protein POM88_023814 [Heracleum sosnowskyi]
MDLVTLNPLCSRYPHQSTSEKQFPVPSLDTIAGLRYGTHCVKIKVRLIRVWDSVSLRTHFEMMTNFILIDEKEKLCWAVTDVAHRPRILSLVCEGLEYYITNFKLVPAQASYKPIDTTNTIRFDKNTDIRGCFDGSFIPRLKFGICSLETLNHRSATTDTLSDVCGVLVKVGRMQREANDEKRLEIHLMDKSLTQLQLTLWGGMATIFTVYLELHRQKNIVLVITGLMVKKRRGQFFRQPRYPKHFTKHMVTYTITDFYSEPCICLCTFLCREHLPLTNAGNKRTLQPKVRVHAQPWESHC